MGEVRCIDAPFKNFESRHVLDPGRAVGVASPALLFSRVLAEDDMERVFSLLLKEQLSPGVFILAGG